MGAQESVVLPKACIMLIHGFGGGVFSWRHIMKSLASQCCCPVLAFDRPGFGLVRHATASQPPFLLPLAVPLVNMHIRASVRIHMDE
jgi:pimeloyl-ACP methyl ester carboxylesterase